MLVKNPETKKAIAVLERYAKAEAQLKTLEKEVKDATALIKEAMQSAGVDGITLDSETLEGYITLAERVSYKMKPNTAINKKYLKQVLDTEKVKAEAVLSGQLPEGVEETRTQYITKKIKVVE